MKRITHIFLLSLILILTACDNKSESSALQYIGSGSITLTPDQSATLTLYTKGHAVPLVISLKDNCLAPTSEADLIKSAPGITYVGTVGSLNAVTEGISNGQSSSYVASQPLVSRGGYIVRFTTKEPGNSAVSNWTIKLFTNSVTDGEAKLSYQVLSSAPQAAVTEPSAPVDPYTPSEPVVPDETIVEDDSDRVIVKNKDSIMLLDGFVEYNNDDELTLDFDNVSINIWLTSYAFGILNYSGSGINMYGMAYIDDVNSINDLSCRIEKDPYFTFYSSESLRNNGGYKMELKATRDGNSQTYSYYIILFHIIRQPQSSSIVLFYRVYRKSLF